MRFAQRTLTTGAVLAGVLGAGAIQLAHGQTFNLLHTSPGTPDGAKWRQAEAHAAILDGLPAIRN